MKILITIMIMLVASCINNETLSFGIDIYHDNENLHEELISFIEKSNYKNKNIAGVEPPKIIESISTDGRLLNKASVYESKTADVGLLSIYPSKRVFLSFMLKNQTYKYLAKDKTFLDGYCQLIKKYIKQGTKLEFIDYKPTKDMPVCFELLETGKAVYKNVNNKNK